MLPIFSIIGNGLGLKAARGAIAESVDQLIKATPQLLKLLENLNPIQKDAVAILCMLIQPMALAKRSHVKISDASLTVFKEEVDRICPPLGAITISEDPCFSATVEYLLALKECQDEGKDEEGWWTH